MSARPIALPVIADAIPEALRTEPRWVIWKSEERRDREADAARLGPDWTKVPYCPASPGRRASSTDSATWSTFDQALAVYRRGGVDGIGFVFGASGGRGWCGFDRDDCHDQATGVTDPLTLAHLAALDTYSELSARGGGVHAVARYIGQPLPGRKAGHFEIYYRARFFTVTGHRLPTSPTTVNERTDAFRSLYTAIFGAPVVPGASTVPADLLAHAGCGTERITDADVVRSIAQFTDDEVLDRMFSAANGTQIRALYNGDTSAHGGDDSSADMALACHLAFWTQRDPARMDRLFRRSHLYRSKWDSRRGAQTYGERTMWRAIERTSEMYQPGIVVPDATLPGPAATLTAAEVDAPFTGDF